MVNGYVRFDDQQRAFLVERIENADGPDGEKWIFLFQYKGKRTLIFENTGVPQWGPLLTCRDEAQAFVLGLSSQLLPSLQCRRGGGE
jgi:hypothetical protein